MNTTKKLLTTLLLALMLPVIALAYDFEVNGIYYLINGSEVTVTSQTPYYIHSDDYTGDVVIPDTVTYNGITYPVTAIGDHAFYWCSNLTSIHIPKTINRFEGQMCFYGCSNLSVVEIESLESWCSIDFEVSPGYNFSYSNPLSYAHDLYLNGEKLTELVIPDGVTRIGTSAFCRLYSLRRLEIPSSVTTIGDEAFAGCRSIERLDIPDLETWLKIEIQGFGSNPMSCSSKIYFDGIEMPRDLVIPETTTKILANAFNGCHAITSVSIPSSVETIGANAFWSCDSLERVDIQDLAAWCNIDFETVKSNPISNSYHEDISDQDISVYVNGSLLTQLVVPEGVTSIGAYAFYDASLTKVSFPNTLVSIGDLAFFHNSFEEVILPESLESLGIGAFYACSFLKKAQINNGLEVIPDGAFSRCYQLSELSIPSTIKKIEYEAFSSCTNLTTMPITDSLQVIGDEAFYYSGIETLKTGKSLTSIGEHAFSNCRNLTSVEICDPVTTLGQLAFYFNDSLQKAVIGNGVHKIPERLFESCGNLISVALGNAVDTLEEHSFEYCEKIDTIVCMAAVPPVVIGAEDSFFEPVVFQNATLYVPIGSVEAYKTANVWKNFQKIVGVNDVNDDDYEYVPFVREGVKWVYYYDNPFNVEVLGMADGIQYYSFELKGDTVIDGKSYKPVQLSYLTSTGEETTQDFVPAYLREEDKKVYAILPEGRWYPQCPVGLGLVVSSNPNYSVAADEFVLYDFNDPTSLYEEYEGFFPDYTYTDTIAVGTNHLCKRHHYVRDYGPQNEMLIIEGYGYVSGYGMPLYYFPTLITGMQVFYHLSHVIENGKIIYKGTHYDPDLFDNPGDVNGDGEVNIADANSVIDVVIMGGNSGHTRIPAADMNDDGEVNITDVNEIINLIINNN